MKQKYCLHYVEGCSPKVKSFNPDIALKRFLRSFVEKHGGLDDKGGNWVELDKIYFGHKIQLQQIFAARKARK
jgi:hypothetical protein